MRRNRRILTASILTACILAAVLFLCLRRASGDVSPDGAAPGSPARTAATAGTPRPFVTADTVPAGRTGAAFRLDTAIRWELPDSNCARRQQIVGHYAYTVSFNPEWHIPNWVAYEMEACETDGDCGRKPTFRPDPKVVAGCASHKDYTKSGYDRGHMAPAADMRWSEQAMAESFYTSNICPQLHSLNAGDWKTLEEKCRGWARHYGSLYIACGPIVADGYKTIGPGKVAVPEAFFKVIFRGENGSCHGIGFLFEHKPQRRPLAFYAVSIDEIEKLTGLDFFYALPDSIENDMEQQCAPEQWP